ncbi:MAG: L,D-transpeptidase family protein [Pseudomonadales bacterium]|nr:L,D-transpeptidase family protein [Pseudomonadales bacterium]
MFPNPFPVYLHYTSSPELFNKNVRTLSSGCIRLERPRALFELVADNVADWPQEGVPERIDQIVVLKRPVTVHLLYWTAWVDDDQHLQLRPDVYGRDQPLLVALKMAAP